MATRKILRVKVKRECIDKGTPRYNNYCPVWWAIQPRLKEGCKVEVGYTHIRFYVPYPSLPGRYIERSFSLPKEARLFISGFDYEGKAMLGYLDEPFEFVLDDFVVEGVFKPEHLEKTRF